MWDQFSECPQCGQESLGEMTVGPPHCGLCGYTVPESGPVCENTWNPGYRTAEENANFAGTPHGAVECHGDHVHGQCDRSLVKQRRSRFTQPEHWPSFTYVRVTEFPRCDRCGAQAQSGVLDAEGTAGFGLCGHCTDTFGPSILAQGLSLYPLVLVGAS